MQEVCFLQEMTVRQTRNMPREGEEDKRGSGKRNRSSYILSCFKYLKNSFAIIQGEPEKVSIFENS